MLFTASILAASVAAALAGGLVLRRRRADKVERSFRALAAAVPDIREEPSSGYRRDLPPSSALAPHSRVALELSPATQRAWQVQAWFPVVSGPAAALMLGLLPIATLGPFSALLGAALGLGMGAAVIDDQRGVLTALGFFSLLIIPFSAWGWVAGVVTFAAARGVLELKDAAGRDEADIERIADARFLSGSIENRAGAVARRRRSGGPDLTAATARDNTKML